MRIRGEVDIPTRGTAAGRYRDDNLRAEDPRRPNVEVQAVFTRDGRIWSERLSLRIRAQLGWLQAKREGVSDAAPRVNRLWRSEPMSAERCRRVGDALERVHAVGKAAPHLARHPKFRVPMLGTAGGSHVLVSELTRRLRAAWLGFDACPWRRLEGRKHAPEEV